MITVEFLELVKSEYGKKGWYDATTYGGEEATVGSSQVVEFPINGLTTARGKRLALRKEGLYPTSYRILYDRTEDCWTVSLAILSLFVAQKKRKYASCPNAY